VNFTRVQMDEHRAVRGEHTPRLDQSRFQEREVVLERVGETAPAETLGAIARAGESGAIAARITRGAEQLANLASAGVERRIDVDESRAGVRQTAQDFEVVAADDAPHAPAVSPRSRSGARSDVALRGLRGGDRRLDDAVFEPLEALVQHAARRAIDSNVVVRRDRREQVVDFAAREAAEDIRELTG
jgi:hypothetical protein